MHEQKKKKPSMSFNVDFEPMHASGEIRRPTRRPTAAVKITDANRIQEALLGTFTRFLTHSMDMEALIFFTLQSLEGVTPDTYAGMHRYLREHILKNFAIHQGGPLRLADQSMYRLTVCYTDDTDV